MRDLVLVAAIAAGCATAVGVAGLGVLRLLRRRSLRVSLAAVPVITVLALVAGIVGTAEAMFLSSHDFGVVIVVCLVAGAVSLVVAVVLGGQVVAGSRILRDAARGLGAEAPYTVSAVPPTGELAQLNRDLAEVSARLAESRERERALESSRRELVAWVSHDLRTPLAGLRAMAEALEDGVADDPRRYHEQMRVEVDRLTGMVDDLFELSRIQAGALRLSLRRIDLSALVGEVLAGTEAFARAHGVRLAAHAGPVLPVRADGRELSRVLANLVVNAIRHTPSDGTVEVQATQDAGAAVLAVSDCCGGIPDGDLGRVFEVGWRGTPARTPDPGSPGGAGLGLTIVRGIVEAHAGEVAVANTATGCRFEIRLRLAPA